MRSKLLLNYLCLSALSIIHQYPSCIAEAADSAASSTNEKGYRINEDPRQNNQQLINDNENRKNQRRQSIDKQIQTPVRRKRELGDAMSSLRMQQRSLINPSREQRSMKRSDHQTGIRNSRKISGNNNKNNEGNNKMNLVAKIGAEVEENLGNQDKQNIRASKEDEEKEMKRSLHSNSALTTLKSKSSRAEGSNESVKLNLEDEEPEENLEEYNDETGEEDEDKEFAGNVVSGVKKNGEENLDELYSENENLADEYGEFDGREMGKREAERGLNAEEYEDCDTADEESGQEEEQEIALTERKREGFDGRVKRNDNEGEDNEEDLKSGKLEERVDESKREIEESAEVEKSGTETPNESAEKLGVKKEAKVDNLAENESLNGDNLIRNSIKNSDSDSGYEKKVEKEIQQKIDSIKEEIKRAIEEREKIREIEMNNAKFDELQSETDEDESEEEQNLNAVNSEPENNPSKRSIGVSKRIDKRRSKRSESKDLALQLRAVEGVEKIDPDILRRSKLRHESIKKRSAPVFGAVDTPEPLVEQSFSPQRIYLSNNEEDDTRSSLKNRMIIPEQAKAKIEDEIPADLSLDPNLLLLNSEKGKENLKRSPELINFTRRRRASAVIPDGRVAFLGYRPDQDDEDDDEGGEFEDDGFQDRTSNLREEKSYYTEEKNQGNYFLFPGLDRGIEDDSLVRRKRAGSHGGGATLGRRRARGKAKQLQNAKLASRKKNLMDRDKRQAEINTRSDNTASLVDSAQELSPQLATEYKEAFGGLQSDPGGALARFKRVKRSIIRGS